MVALVLLAVSIVVAVSSIFAWHYFYGSTAQGSSRSVPADPTIVITSGGSYTIGSAIGASATLLGGQSPSGNITFALYQSLADCKAGTNARFSDTVMVNKGNGTYSLNSTYTPTSADTYYWNVRYSGDNDNQSATDACSFPVEVRHPRHETTAYQEETTSLLREGELASPPDSTLSYGGREVRVSVSASYCWGTAGGSFCADGVPTIPPRKKTLHVPSGSEMELRYEAPRPPNKVSVSAKSFDEKDMFGQPEGSGGPLKVHGSGVERTIPAELPPGEYGVYVYVKDPQGDLYYLFRVMVE